MGYLHIEEMHVKDYMADFKENWGINSKFETTKAQIHYQSSVQKWHNWWHWGIELLFGLKGKLKKKKKEKNLKKNSPNQNRSFSDLWEA